MKNNFTNNKASKSKRKGKVMSEIEKLILEKLDTLSQVVFEVKEEVGLAREEASLAREEAKALISFYS